MLHVPDELAQQNSLHHRIYFYLVLCLSLVFLLSRQDTLCSYAFIRWSCYTVSYSSEPEGLLELETG